MKKKKLAIVTFHRADNLGAVLQAYALQKTLEESFGVEAEILDYRCRQIEEDQKSASGLKKLALSCYYFIKHRGFEGFRKKYLKLSRRFTKESVRQAHGEYDGFITGSDQVWNYECSGWDDTYFLDFVSDKKKYAYSASIGQFRFSGEEPQRVKSLLSDFSMISVREESAAKELAPLWQGDIRVCSDPVGLLTKEQWCQITPKRLCRQKYVFVYMIMDSPELLQKAQAYAKAKNYKLICNKKSLSFMLNGSPTSFLSWMYHAECVFTNSFHGTAFSLIMGKRFFADINHSGRINARVYEMLERTNMQHCAEESSVYDDKICYAENALQTLRETSFEYLGELCKDLGA